MLLSFCIMEMFQFHGLCAEVFKEATARNTASVAQETDCDYFILIKKQMISKYIIHLFCKTLGTCFRCVLDQYLGRYSLVKHVQYCY